MTWRHLATAAPIGQLYFATATLSLLTSRFNGGAAFCWLSSALLIANLVPRARSEWLARAGVCFAASVIATGLFGIGWALAVPIAFGNIGEALVGALLMQRLLGQRVVTGSMESMFLAALAVAIAAPVMAATMIGLSLTTRGFDVAHTFVDVLLGHGLGNLIFTPLALQLSRRGYRQLLVDMRNHQGQHALPLLVAAAATAGIVFSQESLPLLFLPLMPLVFVSYRLGYSASAVAVVILALIGGGLTLSGHGPVQIIDAPLGYQVQFLQFYLASTIVTIMPVAAGMHGRTKLDKVQRLSEARYRMLAEHSTDVLLHIGRDHRIQYISPAITRITGRQPGEYIDEIAATLMAPEDHAHVGASHFKVIEAGGEVITFEYRTLGPDGDYRWLEARARLVVGKNGEVEGVISMLRDVTARKATEARLSHEAYIH